MPRYAVPSASCTIDLVTREFRSNGVLVILSPKVFDCLAYLIAHHDRAIGRDELIAAVWGKADISDDLLGQLVVKARRTVGDSGSEQNFIRTIPRFGYRWTGDIERLPDERNVLAAAPPERVASEQPHTAPKTPLTEHRRMPGRAIALVVGSSLLALIALALPGWWAYRSVGPSQAPMVASSLAVLEDQESGILTAVLPVEVEADGQWGWLRLGMMDLIGDRLRASGLRVVSSDSVVSLSRVKADDPLLTMRSATGAQQIVEPRAVRDGTGWDVRLIVRGARSDDVLDVAARDKDVLVATHDAVRQLLVKLGHVAAAGATGLPVDLPVHELLSRIEAAVLSDDLAMAQRLLDSAPESLRRSPQVRLRLADIDERFGRYELAHQQLEELIAEVQAEIDPVLRGRVLYRYGIVAVRRDMVELALKNFDAARLLLEGRNEPGEMGKVLNGRGIAFALQGRYDQAAEEFSKARVAYELAGDMVSLAALESNEGALENLRHRPASALVLLDKAINRMESIHTFNGLPQAYASKIKALLLLLSPDAAVAAGKDFDVRFPDAPAVTARAYLDVVRADALAASGQLSEAEARLEQLDTDDRIRSTESTRARIHVAQAQLRRIAGDPETTERLARGALGVLVLADDSGERSRGWRELILALLMLGRVQDAETEARAFSDWAAPLSDSRAQIRALLSTAEVARVRGQGETGGSSFKQALELALKEGVPAYVAEAAIAYANALLEEGDVASAMSVASRAFNASDRDFDCALLKARLYHALGDVNVWRAALAQAKVLAGERRIPPALLVAPGASATNGGL